MKRTTIMLPDDVDARLRLEERLRGVSLAEVARELIERALDTSGPARRRKLSFIGAGESDTPGDLGERSEEHLAEIYEQRHRRRQQEWDDTHPDASSTH